jgi:DNA-directed RNA polymerase specialized sigma24 family protein
VVTVDAITPDDLKIAKQGAMSAYRSGRGLVTADDLIAEANLWVVEHVDKVVLWHGQGKHGQNKLRNACRQRCLTIIMRERKRRSNLEHGDIFYYNRQMVRELMPDIFDEDDWSTGSTAMSDTPKGPSKPSEGNNRLAMVADLRSAYFGLPEKDQQFLADMYKDGGLPIDVVGVQWGITERTVRRRDDRILEKMVERLGGEPPWAR